jgi:hypothetical protein
MTTGSLLHADDPASTSSDGYKTVNVDNDGKPIAVRVKQQTDPLAHANLTDELDHQRSFSATNPMSNKSFSLAETTAIHGSSDYNKRSDENTFNTKSYSFDPNTPTVPNLNAKPGFHNAAGFAQPATGYDKDFTTSAADTGHSEASPFSSTTATEQGRSATLGGGTTDTYASSLNNQKFEGDEAEAAQRHLKKLGNGQIEIENVPDRPLTIDEVRQLINHGFTPDTSAPPEGVPAKPMNDPNYQPQPLRGDPTSDSVSTSAPAPARLAPGPVSDDDKDDPVPPPGTMSAPPPPENTQPLPQP